MIFAQDGHGPSNKIDEGMDLGYVSGVILSPRSSTPDKLIDNISKLKTDHSDKTIMMDPCFYVSSMGVSSMSKLTTHPYFKPQLTRKDFSPQNIQQFVKETIDYQVGLGLTEVISPTYRISSFDDAGSQIAIQLFVESIRYVESLQNSNLGLHLCLFAHEHAYSERESLSEFLDVITMMEPKGFYVIAERATSTALQWSDPICLTNAMYLTYALRENEFEVIWGYTDLVGALFNVAGSSTIANGWHKNLKMFNREMYLESTPKRQPASKYTSEPLLNLITINPDMQSVYELGILDEILSDSQFDPELINGPASAVISNESICLQHWQVLEHLVAEVDNGGSVDDKIAIMRGKIDLAQSIYAKLRLADIRLVNEAGSAHLDVWETALLSFKDRI